MVRGGREWRSPIFGESYGKTEGFNPGGFEDNLVLHVATRPDSHVAALQAKAKTPIPSSPIPPLISCQLSKIAAPLDILLI